MTSLPLHPAVVHLPLGLAFIIPLLAIGFTWALWAGRVRLRAWAVIVALQAVLFGAALIAMNTGEREEEQVEAIVPHAALEQHETYAAQFVWATGITFLLSALPLVFRSRIATRGLAVAAVAGTLIVAAAALRVGHAGGQLVYAHNAGAAYSGNNWRSQTAGPATRECTGQASSRRRRDEECGD